MKKKHLYGAMLWAFLVTANLCTGWDVVMITTTPM